MFLCDFKLNPREHYRHGSEFSIKRDKKALHMFLAFRGGLVRYSYSFLISLPERVLRRSEQNEISNIFTGFGAVGSTTSGSRYT